VPLGYLPARVQLCQCSASCVQNDAYIDIAMLVVFCIYWLLFQFNCYATKLACALERSCRAESETATLRSLWTVPIRVWRATAKPRVKCSLLVRLSAALHCTIRPTDWSGRLAPNTPQCAVLCSCTADTLHDSLASLPISFPHCSRRCVAAQSRQCSHRIASCRVACRYEKDTITVADYSLQVRSVLAAPPVPAVCRCLLNGIVPTNSCIWPPNATPFAAARVSCAADSCGKA
jgi:hypothetical protein